MKRIRKFLTIAILSLIGFCVVLLAFSALGNITLPTHSASVEVLNVANKTRLVETRHLLRKLNDEVWPDRGD